MMRHQGITFTVYGRDQGVERIIPFDPIPRLVAADEWDRIERGLKQRVRALNLFIHDVYHDRLILRDRAVPPEIILGASAYRRECVGLRVPKDIYLHISGIDLIRDGLGRVPRPGGQRPDPFGRQLRPEESPGDEAGVPRPLRAVQRPGGRRLRLEPAGDAPPHRPGRVGRPDGRGPHARGLQLGLLRAQLPRPADGRGAGRGARPVLRRRPDLHEDHPGADAGRRDLPEGRRRLPRPPHLPSRTASSASPA